MQPLHLFQWSMQLPQLFFVFLHIVYFLKGGQFRRKSFHIPALNPLPPVITAAFLGGNKKLNRSLLFLAKLGFCFLFFNAPIFSALLSLCLSLLHRPHSHYLSLFLPRCLSLLSSLSSLPSVSLSHLKACLGGNSPPSTSDPIALSCPSPVGCSSVPP